MAANAADGSDALDDIVLEAKFWPARSSRLRLRLGRSSARVLRRLRLNFSTSSSGVPKRNETKRNETDTL